MAPWVLEHKAIGPSTANRFLMVVEVVTVAAPMQMGTVLLMVDDLRTMEIEMVPEGTTDIHLETCPLATLSNRWLTSIHVYLSLLIILLIHIPGDLSR